MFRKLLLLSSVLLLFPVIEAIGQNCTIDKSILIGSWYEIGSKKNDTSGFVSMGATEDKEIISFYSNGRYQLEDLNFARDAKKRYHWHTLQMKANWKLHSNSGIITLGKLSYDKNRLVKLKGEQQAIQIISLIHDTLTLQTIASHNESCPYYKLVLYRVPQRKERTWKTNTEPGDLLLVKNSDSLKTLLLKPFASRITLSLMNDSLLNYSQQVEGELDHINSDSLFMTVSDEQIHFTSPAGIEKTVDTENNGRENLTKGFPIKRILYISTDKIRHPIAHTFGSIVVGLSLIGTIVVAPIAAFNSPHGSFDVPQFLVFSGASLLGGLLVGIPLMVYGQDNQTYYMLDDKKSTKIRQLWHVKPFQYE